MSEIKTTPLRLIDLNPRWMMTSDGEVYGIEYDCPCGLPRYRVDERGGVRLDHRPDDVCKLGDGRQPVPTKTNFAGLPSCSHSRAVGWDLTGDSWETVTLAPSILQRDHWHGFLTNGVLVSC